MAERLGRYILDGLIAEGGMARIYRAHTEGLGGIDRVVALKCLREEVSEDSNTEHMLLDEARITVRMTHKNICQTYGLEHDNQHYFMVMEYIDGINLSQLVRWMSAHNQHFPVEAAIFITMEICTGLSYAHRMLDDKGESLCLIHRDINPQNICISKEGEVKLIDFGIAKARVMSQETQAGTIKGKFNYMSPEQGRGDRIDQRSDIFALAAVLYELLSGQMLYPLSLDDASLRTKVQMAEFTPIEQLRPNLPPMLRQILAKALARNLNQRFATARDFFIALSQFFHGEKVFDALNLSAMVEGYLASQSNGHQGPAPTGNAASAAKASAHGLRALGTDLKENDPPLARLHSNLTAAPRDLEETPTAVYDGAEFNAYASSLRAQELAPHFEIDRNVDLDYDVSASETTQMITAPSADSFNEIPSQREPKYGQSFFSKLLQLSERHLVYLVIALTTILSLAIAVFFSLDHVETATAPAPVNLQSEEMVVDRIYIDSIPAQASIIIDGVLTSDRTPASIPSRGAVTLRQKFYEDKTIRLSDVKDKMIRLELKPKMGRVNIDSTPSRAEVTIDGRFFGQTPLSGLLEMHMAHTIALDFKGYTSQKRILTWESENLRSQNIDVVLVRDDAHGDEKAAF